MKKLLKFSSLLTIMVCFVACNETKKEEEKPEVNTFSISGEIEGLGDSNLYFFYPDKNYEGLDYRMDSIVVSNGKFSFEGTIEGYHFVTFYPRLEQLIKRTREGGYYPSKPGSLHVIAYPGADIKVSGKVSDFLEAYPSGDPVNQELADMHRKAFPKMNESVNYLVEASFLEREAEEERELLKHKADSVGAISNTIKKEFVMNNHNSVGAVYYLSDMMMRDQISEEEAIKAFNALDPNLKEISYFKDVAFRVTAINATKEGSVAPEIITKSTLDGEEFNLASFRGKYVMIDFWGIWCGPCVSEMPRVKEFAENHKDKLEILGVNSGDRKNRIVDFVERNQYDWQQIMDVKGSEQDNFVLKYNVNAFPTKFIIDPEGKIVKKFVGSGEEAFELLEELLAE